MTIDKELVQAVEQMRTGAQDDFLIFFNKTFQFSFLMASKNYTDSKKRNDFLADFYPYLLLHISELTDDSLLYEWMETCFYSLLQIQGLGENSISSASQLFEAAEPLDDSVVLAAAGIVWSQILKNVSFPKKPKKESILFPIVFLGSCAVLLLLVVLLTHSRQLTHTAEIDEINKENQAFSTNTEIESFLNGSASDAATDSTTSPSGSTTVTDIDNSGNAKGTITQSTEAPPAPETPSVATPSVNTPSVSTPVPDTPSEAVPDVQAPVTPSASATAPTVSQPSVSEPAVSTPSVKEPSVTTPEATR